MTDRAIEATIDRMQCVRSGSRCTCCRNSQRTGIDRWLTMTGVTTAGGEAIVVLVTTHTIGIVVMVGRRLSCDVDVIVMELILAMARLTNVGR